MKKINGKQKNILVSASLLLVALVLVFTLYGKLNSNEGQLDPIQEVAAESAPQVDDLEKPEIVEEAVTVADIEPEKITISDDKVEVVVINEPLPTPPAKPELEAPESKPQTNDNLEDMDNMPKYAEEELVIETGEAIIVSEENKVAEPIEEQPAGSSLVPPSENPFANPANAVNPVEIDGSELSDYIPGTGDKF
jgi:hypothetical protein